MWGPWKGSITHMCSAILARVSFWGSHSHIIIYYFPHCSTASPQYSIIIHNLFWTRFLWVVPVHHHVTISLLPASQAKGIPRPTYTPLDQTAKSVISCTSILRRVRQEYKIKMILWRKYNIKNSFLTKCCSLIRKDIWYNSRLSFLSASLSRSAFHKYDDEPQKTTGGPKTRA
jgi:hypothetical protein